MRSSSHDFFSDPLWPNHPPATLQVASHSSDTAREEGKEKGEPQETAGSDCFVHYIKIEEVSNSIQVLTPTPKPSPPPSPSPPQPLPDPFDFDSLIEGSPESDTSFTLGRRYQHGCYHILSKEAKQFLVGEIGRTSIASVSRKYGIAANNLCRWKVSVERRRGAGRKITDVNLERRLIAWIREQQQKDSSALSRRLIQERAKLWAEDKSFKASKGWFQRFARRNKDLGLLRFFNLRARSAPSPPLGPLVKLEEGVGVVLRSGRGRAE